jgi:DNA modification methylase
MQTTERFEKVAVDRLVPYARNARTHSKEQITQLRASLREFGFVNPVICDKEYNIVAGHGRVLAAKAEGMEAVPCVFVEHLTDAQKKAYILADNRLALSAGWDEELLALEFGELKDLGFDLELTGFDADEIEKLFNTSEDVQEDDFDVDAAAEEPPFVQPGDLWLLGRHRLLCGDATKPEDIALLMDGKRANLCVTDPPYNCSYVGKDSSAMTIMNDKMKPEEFYAFLLAAFKNIFDHTVDGGALYVFHSDAEKVNFYNAVVAAGFHYSTTCVWVKNSMVLGRMDYQMQHEPVVYAFKDTAKHKWYADRKQTTVWEFNRPTKSKLHPTMKPLDLVAYPIQNSTQANGIVLDPFGGSGSTLMACEQTDRVCYTSELDPAYASVIVRRFISDFSAENQVFVLRGGEKIPFKSIVT